MERFSSATQSVKSDWALGIEARSRALVTDSEEAYREAIDRLGRTRMRAELARGHLVFGERLRRQERRTSAREQLRIAVDMMTDMGIEAFGDRAIRELRATGERVVKRRVEAPGELTPQELQIARARRTGSPTGRSATVCSSAPERSSGTSGRCSPSSASLLG